MTKISTVATSVFGHSRTYSVCFLMLYNYEVGYWGDMRKGLQWFVGFVFILGLSIDFSLHVIYCTRTTHLKVSNLLCILKLVVPIWLNLVVSSS